MEPERKRISWCKECKKEIWSGEPFNIVATTCQGIYEIRAEHREEKDCKK